VSCGQVNYRTYVRRGDERGVWFFGTSLDSRLVALPRLLWKMPWHRDRLRVEARWGDDGGCRHWRLEATGEWGGASIALRGTGQAYAPPPGFADRHEVSTVLLDPFVGWYARHDGSGVGRYSVWHEPLVLEAATIDDADCRVFADLGLVDAGQQPVSAGVQRHVHFDVHTPPVRHTEPP
jgi:uncharacterized protein YqjF (DUF2071 family)